MMDYDWNGNALFASMVGKTLTRCEQIDDGQIVFETEDANYRMYHSQDCCETVTVESIVGDLSDLIGTPITLAEVAESDESPEGCETYSDSQTWTFYKLATIKGYVDIRWWGKSNGYYSESVTFCKDYQ